MEHINQDDFALLETPSNSAKLEVAVVECLNRDEESRSYAAIARVAGILASKISKT
jgi:hypothetical protein